LTIAVERSLLLLCTEKDPGSDFNPMTGYPAEVYRSFTQFLKGNNVRSNSMFIKRSKFSLYVVRDDDSIAK
jgi:hypothetical protein